MTRSPHLIYEELGILRRFGLGGRTSNIKSITDSHSCGYLKHSASVSKLSLHGLCEVPAKPDASVFLISFFALRINAACRLECSFRSLSLRGL
jgi:hypothetical protein